MTMPVTCFGPVAAPTRAPMRLAMQRLWLTGQVLPAGARLIVQHVFRSEEDAPLEVIYAFPLPRDAALRRFRVTGDGFETTSDLKPTEEAVKTYENAIAGGSFSALFRQYGDGLVNLTVGNIRPKETVTVHLELLAGAELRDHGFRFRFPFTLAPAYHPRMRVAVFHGEGEMELPADEFGDLMLPRFREDASSLHEVGFELSVWHPLPACEIASPSHPISVRRTGADATRVALAAEKDLPNRDLVLDVVYQAKETQVLAGADGAGKRSFAIVVPSTAFGQAAAAPRRIAILLDRSGSMQGAPITQARKAIEACLAALSEDDSFDLFAFDDRVEAMQPEFVRATRDHRDGARKFLDGIQARGGTELAAGVKAAAAALSGQGDIVIITDGQVSGTEAILAQARAAGIRLFCLGIGSASQDRFLALLARETGGISRFVTPREPIDLTAIDLFASMGRPVASGLQASGVEPQAPAAVFAGAPVLLFGEADPESAGRVELQWEGGHLSIDVPPGDGATGETVRLLRGSRLITDWESRYPSEEAVRQLAQRRQSRIAARLVELSTTFGLASREMSLVAVVKRSGDRPGEIPETRVVAVGMPQDVSFEAYFHKPAPLLAASTPMAPPSPAAQDRPASLYSRTASRHGGEKARFAFLAPSRGAEPEPSSAASALVDLAGMLEPDGGMPGATPEIRAARSIAALLAFVEAGHSTSAGAFRLHLQRLAAFLRGLQPDSAEQKRLIEKAIEAASAGKAPSGRWLAIANDQAAKWKQVMRQ